MTIYDYERQVGDFVRGKKAVFTYVTEVDELSREKRLEFSTGIKKIIFNGPATIVFWTNGTKTVVKRNKDDADDREKAVYIALLIHLFGKGAVKDIDSKVNDILNECDEDKSFSIISDAFVDFLSSINTLGKDK